MKTHEPYWNLDRIVSLGLVSIAFLSIALGLSGLLTGCTPRPHCGCDRGIGYHQSVLLRAWSTEVRPGGVSRPRISHRAPEVAPGSNIPVRCDPWSGEVGP